MRRLALLVVATVLLVGCSGAAPDSAEAPAEPAPEEQGAASDEQAAVEIEPEPVVQEEPAPLPPMADDNILNIALNSPDHTTLVQAVQAADLTTAVAASGPLTVFAPTDDAFAKLPAGTVESLMEPESKSDLAAILKYHVAPAVYTTDDMSDGQELGMANMGKVRISVDAEGNVHVNDALIVSSIRGSNGIIHVIDAVLLPPE